MIKYAFYNKAGPKITFVDSDTGSVTFLLHPDATAPASSRHPQPPLLGLADLTDANRSRIDLATLAAFCRNAMDRQNMLPEASRARRRFLAKVDDEWMEGSKAPIWLIIPEHPPHV